MGSQIQQNMVADLMGHPVCSLRSFCLRSARRDADLPRPFLKGRKNKDGTLLFWEEEQQEHPFPLWGRPYKTSAKFSGFWTPSPLSAFGTDLPGSPSDLNTGNGTEGAMVCTSLGRLLRPLFYFLCSNLKANPVDIGGHYSVMHLRGWFDMYSRSWPSC